MKITIDTNRNSLLVESFHVDIVKVANEVIERVRELERNALKAEPTSDKKGCCKGGNTSSTLSKNIKFEYLNTDSLGELTPEKTFDGNCDG